MHGDHSTANASISPAALRFMPCLYQSMSFLLVEADIFQLLASYQGFCHKPYDHMAGHNATEVLMLKKEVVWCQNVPDFSEDQLGCNQLADLI